DGTGYTITVVANDSIDLGSDNQNSSTLTLNLDKTSPTITWITSNNSWVSDDYLVVYFNVSDSGSGVNLSTISVSASAGSIIFSASSNCTGTSAEYACNATWNTTGVADGTGYTITVTANDTISDDGGPDNQNSSILSLNLDKTPPTITWITSNNSWVNEDYFVFYFNVSDSGAGVNLSTISITPSSGSVIFSASSNCTGTSAEYACNATWNTTGVADGTGYTITVVANDSIDLGSDNQNSSTLTLRLDKTPPAVTIISPQNTTYNYSNILINTSVVDLTSGVDTVIAEINGTDNVTLTRQGTTNYWNYSSYVFSDGTNRVRIYANDSATNLNATVVVYFTVDTTPPAVNYVAPTPVDNANLSQDWVLVNVTVVEVTTAIGTCLLEFNGTVNYTMSFTNTTSDRRQGYCSYNVTGLNEGRHNFSVYVNDTQGNLNRTSLRQLTLDRTPPQVVVNVPQDNANVSGILNVNATVTDNLLAVDTVQFNLSNTTWSSLFTMSRQAGTDYWNYSLDTTTLQDGLYNITFLANDTAGNLNSTERVTVTVDNNAPVVSFVSPTPATGTITNRTYVYINVSVQDVTPDTGLLEWNGSINYTMTKVGSTFWYNKTNLADGIYSYRVYVNDSYGNINVTETRSITIDTAILSITVANISTSASNNYTDNATAPNTVIIVNTGSTEVNGTITINEYNDVPVGVNPLVSAYGLGAYEKGINRYINATPSDNLNATSGNVSWVIIRMYYSDSDVSDVVEGLLSLYWYNVSGGNWVKLAPGLNLTPSGGPYVFETGVDTANNYVWANVSHLSVYSIGGRIAGITAQFGNYQPEVVILGNSIDLELAEEFVSLLRDTGIRVHITGAQEFWDYSTRHYIIILGGPKAYDGVGEIVSGILTAEEKRSILEGSVFLKKRSVFREGGIVYIFAGRDRSATAEAWQDVYRRVAKEIEYNWG
ncbi:MAG: hypothetical protein GXO66_09550, partial [Euryarchaeota archaeon]|nr:hypothetical protein [Euryarchaeota archaeon]